MSRTTATPLLALLGVLLGLSACSKYAITLNEKVVYMPPSLFSDYQIVDANLRTCVAQTISDQQVVQVQQLRHLNCSSAGIVSLTGLARFYALEELNLASNALTDIEELQKLGKLHHLVLRDNPISDAGPLLRLLHLRQLDLSQSPNLGCADVLQLHRALGAGLQPPEQCQASL